MTPKNFPRGSKGQLGVRDPPKKFFQKSENMGEILQKFYKFDLLYHLHHCHQEHCHVQHCGDSQGYLFSGLCRYQKHKPGKKEMILKRYCNFSKNIHYSGDEFET